MTDAPAPYDAVFVDVQGVEVITSDGSSFALETEANIYNLLELSNGYSIQIASDINRDGLGLELIDINGDVLAEVFRSDRENSLTFSAFVESIPYVWVEALIFKARMELGCFENGAAFPPNIEI